MPNVHQLLADHDLTSKQRLDMQIAYDESHDGFERVAVEASTKDSPTGYLIAMIRNNAHLEPATKPLPDRKPRATLEHVVDVACRLYRARIKAYPPIDERGWTLDDAIAYGVDHAQFAYRIYTSNEIEREMRIEIGQPWDENSDPDLGTGCPPDLMVRIRTKSRQIGTLRLPDEAPIEAPPEAAPVEAPKNPLASDGLAATLRRAHATRS